MMKKLTFLFETTWFLTLVLRTAFVLSKIKSDQNYFILVSNLVHKHEVTELALDSFEKESLHCLLLLSCYLLLFLRLWVTNELAYYQNSLCSNIHGCFIILYLHLSPWELRRENLRPVSTITVFQRQTRISPDSSCLMVESEQIT